MIRLITVCLLLSMTTSGYAQELASSTKWVNKRHSVLTIGSIDTNGHFKGTFVNNASGYRCVGQPFEVSGQVNGQNISFAVSFAPCFSLVIWNGQLTGNTIKTHWHLEHVTDKWDFEAKDGEDAFVKAK
jgi:hypothetical protein